MAHWCIALQTVGCRVSAEVGGAAGPRPSLTGPAGTTFVTPGVGNAGTVTGTTATLAAGASRTFTLVVNADSSLVDGDTITNTATVTTTTGETSTTNNTSTTSISVVDQGGGGGGLEDFCNFETLNVPGADRTAEIRDNPDNSGTNVLVITGSSGNDTIQVLPDGSSRMRVTINGRTVLRASRSDADSIVVFAGSGNDTVIINAALQTSALLLGEDGNDNLYGAKGNDTLDGGSGNDRLFGGLGNDILCGDEGNDYLYGQAGNDSLGGDEGNDKIYGEAGDDYAVGGEGNDSVYGGLGNDRVYGLGGNDKVFGEAGNDVVVGGSGNDALYGGAGRDFVVGGEGSDKFFGDSGDDVLIGGNTSFEEDDVALSAFMAELSSTSSFNNRLNNFQTGGGLTDGNILDESTVFNDNSADEFFGGSNSDLFFSSSGDRLRDRTSTDRNVSIA